MSREAVEQLMDRWINEPSFRAEIRQDPEGTVRRIGAELDPDEWAAVHSMDWSLPDEELRVRASRCA